MTLPRVATIQDISGVGRCSLTAAIPIFSAMGVQACPLPTAVLSNQTAFESYAVTALTGQLADSIALWKKQGLAFDGVSTGFLTDTEQARLVGEFIDYAKSGGALVVIDPVMGDAGSLYPIFGQDMLAAFAELVAKADVITPNLTEACLLAGAEYPGQGAHSHELVWEIAHTLSKMGPDTVVVTGVHDRDNAICNMAYVAGQGKKISVCNRQQGGSFSGTGDILTSIICACLLRGGDVESALRLAGQLFERAIALSIEKGTDPREGVAFEPYLHLLPGTQTLIRQGEDAICKELTNSPASSDI